jgi:hypothetical protein
VKTVAKPLLLQLGLFSNLLVYDQVRTASHPLICHPLRARESDTLVEMTSPSP